MTERSSSPRTNSQKAFFSQATTLYLTTTILICCRASPKSSPFPKRFPRSRSKHDSTHYEKEVSCIDRRRNIGRIWPQNFPRFRWFMGRPQRDGRRLTRRLGQRPEPCARFLQSAPPAIKRRCAKRRTHRFGRIGKIFRCLHHHAKRGQFARARRKFESVALTR